MQVPEHLNQISYFSCPQCGGQIPNTMPQGLKIPCMHCQQPIVCPGGGISNEQAQEYQQFMADHGAAAAAASDQQHREQNTPGAAFFGSTSRPILARRPDGQTLIIGGQVGEDGGWFIRAVDLQSQQVLWEALRGHRDWTEAPSETSMFYRGGTFYVCLAGGLFAVDLTTGQEKWAQGTAPIKNSADLGLHGDEAAAFEIEVQGRRVLVTATEADAVTAYDVDTGAGMWTRTFTDLNSISPIEGVGVLVDHVQTHEIVGAADGATVASFSSATEPGYDDPVIIGDKIYFFSDNVGPEEEQEGVSVIDAVSGQQLTFRDVEGADLDTPPVMVTGQLLFLVDANDERCHYHMIDFQQQPSRPGFFARLFGGGSKPQLHDLPFASHGLDALKAAGNIAYFDKREDDRRRLLGIDVTTHQTVFDSGEISEEPSSMDTANMQVAGDLAVYVTSPEDDDNECELRGLVQGKPIWSLPVGDWDAHFFMGDLLVVYSGNQQTLLVNPADGQIISAYPFR